MSTSLVHKKLAFAFGAYDVTRDNLVDRDDFIEIARRLAVANGHAAGSAAHKTIEEQMLSFWSAFEAVASKPQLSVDDWIRCEEAFTSDRAQYRQMLEGSIGVLFPLLDLNHDGALSLEEYRSFLQVHSRDVASAEASYARLDAGNKGGLSLSDVIEAYFQFYTSDDPDAAGNWLYGALP